MADLHNKFLIFHQEISLPSYKKNKLMRSKDALKEKIKNYFKEKTGITTPKFYIQGSYKMGTIVIEKDGTYDVDLGVYFTDSRITEYHPSTIQKWVQKAVQGHTTGGTQHKDKCIKVIYVGDYDIDLPVYYQPANGGNTELATKSGWLVSDSRELYDWISKRFTYDGQLKRIIKYLKVWGKISAGKMPSGIAFTVWVAEHYVADQHDDIALLNTARNIWNSFPWFGLPTCKNPTYPYDDLLGRLNSRQIENFKSRFGSFIDNMKTATNTYDRYSAVNIWRQELGNKFPL